jgi:hypothetical protein
MNAINSSVLSNPEDKLLEDVSGSAFQKIFNEVLEYTNTSKLTPSFDWMQNCNAFQRIKNLAHLPEKWDGYDAPKFSRKQINRALEVFAFIQSYQKRNQLEWHQVEPFISPSSDGSILFEWGGKRFPHRNLEIYVAQEPDLTIEYLKTDIKMDSDIEEKCQMDGINDLLNWLFTSDT